MTCLHSGRTRRAWLGGVLAALVVAGAGPARADVPVSLLNALALARPTERTPAPGFVLPRLDGQRVSLGGLLGRPVLLYFWTTW